MAALQTAAFGVLLAVFIFRARSAYYVRQSRLSWAASGIGALALLTLGTVIPLESLDGMLGGTNVIYVIQNVLATLAFWFVMRASVADPAAPNPGKRRSWPLFLLLIAFVIPFFFITDRAPTSSTFIRDHVDQLGALLCASIYMLGIATISAILITGVRRRQARIYWLFRIGSLLVIVASASEITGLVLNHFGPLSAQETASIAHNLFDPFFYSGVITIVAGIASFTVQKWIRGLVLKRNIRGLAKILDRRHIASPVDEDGALVDNLYDLVISIRDQVSARRFELDRGELRRLTSAERWITRNLPGLIGDSSTGLTVRT
jgi:hypothetical protein